MSGFIVDMEAAIMNEGQQAADAALEELYEEFFVEGANFPLGEVEWIN